MTHDQGKLVYDFLDALGELVRALGGPKTIGQKLRPELPFDQAAQWVRDCLNPNRREKFDPMQVKTLLHWGRETGHHEAMWFLTEDIGYSKPSPVDPADEYQQLQRRYIDTVAEHNAIAERMERLASSPIRAVK